jgi:hypothetical protein
VPTRRTGYKRAVTPRLPICWYFLKSTDPLVDMAVSSLVYEDDSSNSSVEIKVVPKEHWALRVQGYVRADFLLPANTEDALELTDFAAASPKAKRGYQRFVASGRVDADGLLRFAREYFGASGYWYEDHNAA